MYMMIKYIRDLQEDSGTPVRMTRTTSAVTWTLQVRASVCLVARKEGEILGSSCDDERTRESGGGKDRRRVDVLSTRDQSGDSVMTEATVAIVIA